MISNAIPQSTLANNANPAQLVEQAIEPQSLANPINAQEPMKITPNELFNKGIDGLNEHTNLVQVSSHVMRSMMSTNHSNSLMSGGDFLLDEKDSKLINSLITESSKLSEQILESLNNDDEEERLLAERYGTDESVTKTISAVISKSISNHLSDLTVLTKETLSLEDKLDEKEPSLDSISLSEDLPSAKDNATDNDDITISDIELDEDYPLDEDDPLDDFPISDIKDDNYSDLDMELDDDFDMDEELDDIELDDESVALDDESNIELDVQPSDEQKKKPSVLGKIRESIRSALKRESKEAKVNEDQRSSFLFRAQKKSCAIQ